MQGQACVGFAEMGKEMSKKPNAAMPSKTKQSMNEHSPSEEWTLLKGLPQKFPKLRTPRRLVTRSGSRVRGVHSSLRHGVAMEWETPEESVLIQVLDASPSTQWLRSQVGTFEIESIKGCFEYTPDVAVMRFGEVTFIECKPGDVIALDVWTKKFHAISSYLREFDINFVVLPNEVSPSEVVQENVSFVLRGGSALQYPLSRRKEDRELLIKHRPQTFRRINRSAWSAISQRSDQSRFDVHRHERTSYVENINSL